MKIEPEELVSADDNWIIPVNATGQWIYLISLIAPWIVGLRIAFYRSPWGEVESNLHIFFYIPLLVYSSCAMFLLLWDVSTYSAFWFIRFGVYTGIILAIQFMLQIAFTDDFWRFGLILGTCSLLIGYPTIIWVRKAKQRKLLAIILIIIFMIFIFSHAYNFYFTLLFVPFVSVALCPVIACITARRLWLVVDKGNRNNLATKIGSWVVWGLLWGAAGVITVNQLIQLPF